MSFGGAVGAMLTSLKNNSRSRKSAFEKLEKFDGDSGTKLHFENKLTANEFKALQKRLQQENNIKNIRLAIYIVLFLLVVVLFFTLT